MGNEQAEEEQEEFLEPVEGIVDETLDETLDDSTEESEVNWQQRVTDWGGEDNITNAIELQKALQTKEGLTELTRQALVALGLENKDIDGLFAAKESVTTPTVDDLLADPDRVLTAAEVKLLLDNQQKAAMTELHREASVKEIVNTMDRTFKELDVNDDDKAIITALADRVLGEVVDIPSIKEVENAIRQAHAMFMAKVEQSAQNLLKNKQKKNATLPSTLGAGVVAGTEKSAEPQNMAEAKRMVREMLRNQ